ncbi:hypothetical protein F5I97DRAFT_1884454 [Phlebopus sp. FC_14]|nr:hypothetical protein F5I97DRAFT_1884454 [Phlebopus sp. FC_14]
MATTAHIIRSHYDPADREKLERETGQIHNDSDPWQTESSFSAQRRIRSAPSFVPAAVPYNEWGLPSQLPSTNAEQKQPSAEVSEWYKSLTASTSSAIPSLRNTSRELPSRPSSAPGSDESPKEHFSDPITKNNWFITRALRSEPSSKPRSPVPSVADMLARDPPPLPSEQRFTPPVWLAIGPSNKGFSMLQRSGWSEGEGLGAHVARHSIGESGFMKVGREDQQPGSSVAVRPIRLGEGEGAIEIIDLTQSGSDSDSDSDFETYEVAPQTSQQTRGREDAPETSLQKSLLTPLPTILKSDRLGIGLKAKTEGPYRQSKKRVTHNAAAMAAHIRASKEMREKKKKIGRGRRGFAKMHEREENKRKRTLAYLND